MAKRLQKYVVLASGQIYESANRRQAEQVYKESEHARMEYWANRNDWDTAIFIKKK